MYPSSTAGAAARVTYGALSATLRCVANQAAGGVASAALESRAVATTFLVLPWAQAYQGRYIRLLQLLLAT